MNTNNTEHYFLTGGGEMGKLIRDKDWSKTPLGNPDNWPQSLRTMVSVMLDNPFGMYIAWGKEYTQIYNDGYRPILGATKHPEALGISTRETFSEIWHIIGSMFEGVMNGSPVGFPDFMLELDRNGFVETCYFDFAYSPIRMENGEVGGVLVTVIETTDKKKAELELKESNDQLQFAIEAAQLGTFDFNPITNKFNANSRLKEWFGLPPEDQIELNDAISAIADTDKLRVSKAIQTALEYASGGSYDIEYTIVNPVTQKETIVHAKGRAWFNEQKMAYRLNGTLEDVTEETIARRKTVESEQIIRNMVLDAPIGICVMDANTLVSEIVNERFVEIAGKPLESIVGKYYWDTFKEAKDYYEAALASVVKTGIPYYSTEVATQLIRHGKEETIFVTFVYAPLKNEAGEVSKIAVWVVDNTMQVVAREKVAQSERNLRLMILQAPVAIAIMRDTDYKVEIVNKNALQLWGRTEEEVLNKSVFTSMPELQTQGIKELLDDVRNTGNRFATAELPVQLLRNEVMETVFINFSYEPLYDEAGKINGIMAIGFDVSQQVIARQKVEQSEIRYNMMLMESPFAFLILKGREMVVHLANQSMKEVLGKGNDIEGKPLLEILPEIKGQAFPDLLDNVYTTGIPFSANEMLAKLMHNGKLEDVYFNYVYQPYYEADKTISGVTVIAYDITSSVMAKKKIEESAKQFTTLANSIQNLAWMANADGWIYWYNERWYEYTGTTPQEMEGWGWQSVHDPEQLPHILEKWKHSINTGEPFEMVFPLKGKDNMYRPFLTRIHSLKDENGEVIRWIGTNTDISAQKEAEEQFRQMAERMPQKVWTADALGNRNYFNQVMLDYTGLTFDELKDWGWNKIVHPDDWPKTKQIWEHSISTGEDLVNEYRLLGKDGKYLWHLVRATAIKDENGKPKMWIGSKTEIQKQIELSETLGDNLQQSKERMQTILQYAPDAVISIDEDGIIRNWNPEAENIFGWTESEAIGKTLSETIVPERYNQGHENGIKHFLKTGEGPFINKPIELSAIKKNGHEFPVELKISTSKINGRYIFIGFIRDISIRKQAEETIQNKTNQLMEAQQLAHMGSWEWDVLSNKIGWSDELFRIYGLAPQEFEADYESFLRYTHLEDREYVNGIVQQAYSDHQPFTFFQRIVRTDGQIRIISATGKVYTNDKGDVIKMSGTAQDVTEQKKYEEELKISEERFYKIFDSNPVPMSLAEIQTNKIKYANNLFYTAFGYTKDEVIGYSSEELNLIDPEEYKRVIDVIFGYLHENRSLAEVQALSKEETEELLLKLKQSEQMKDFEILYTRKNGETFPALVSFEVIRIGTESYTVTSYQDITERKKAEALLKNQNEQLEKMNKELESFAYISSHDLQEPLRKIQTFASQIAEREINNLSDSGKDKFQRMQNAANRMQNLIQDLLAYSRTNNQEKKFEITDLNQIIEEVKEDLTEELQQKNAIVEIEGTHELKIIPFQFRQLMFNLISNSLKFTAEERAPRIKITIEVAKGDKYENDKLSKDVSYCHICVKDNGIGFEQEYSHKIFELFKRLHEKSRYNGTGIGLAIVKKIVENHNGMITADGELDKGATFNIYIPLN